MSLDLLFVLGPSGLSGGVKTVRCLAEALARRGHRCRIACTEEELSWWQVRRRARRLTRPFLWGRRFDHLAASSVPVQRIRGSAIDWRQVEPADVVIATWWPTMERLDGWPPGHGEVAYLVQHHEIYFPERERVEATYRRPGLKLVVARWLEKVMRESYGAGDVCLVPNGIDRGEFFPDLSQERGRPTVGFLWGDHEVKGTDIALAALRLLAAERQELRVLSFGAMPLGSNHDPHFEAPEGLRHHVRPSPSTLRRLYQSCDCWIVPSRSEGFGLPGLEAMACGIPVVATRSGGPEDYVEPGLNGDLVPVDDPGALAAAVAEILDLPEAEWRARQRACLETASRFDWDHSAELAERAFIGLCAGRIG